MLCMQIETFHASVIAPSATMIVCGVLYDGMHPISARRSSCLMPYRPRINNRNVHKEGNYPHLLRSIVKIHYLALRVIV